MKNQDLIFLSYVINIVLIFATIILMIGGMLSKIGGVILLFAIFMIIFTFAIEMDS